MKMTSKRYYYYIANWIRFQSYCEVSRDQVDEEEEDRGEEEEDALSANLHRERG